MLHSCSYLQGNKLTLIKKIARVYKHFGVTALLPSKGLSIVANVRCRHIKEIDVHPVPTDAQGTFNMSKESSRMLLVFTLSKAPNAVQVCNSTWLGAATKRHQLIRADVNANIRGRFAQRFRDDFSSLLKKVIGYAGGGNICINS